MAFPKFVFQFKLLTTVFIRGVVILCLFWVLQHLLPSSFSASSTVAVIEPFFGDTATSSSSVNSAYGLAFDWINSESIFGFNTVDVIHITGEITEPYDVANIREKLVENDVDAVFGCQDAACVRLMLPVIEELKIPFFYPLPHEGLVDTQYGFFLGRLPNQSIAPAVSWALKKFGNRVHITGSNTLYSRMVGEMVKNQVFASGGSITGEQYYGRNIATVETLPQPWNAAQTDFIVNLVVGDALVGIMQLQSLEVQALKRPPQVFAALDRTEINDIGRYALIGDFYVTNYIPGAHGELTSLFQELWDEKMGVSNPPGAAEATAFHAARLWHAAFKKTSPGKSADVVDALYGMKLEGALGFIAFDRSQHYLSHSISIIEILENGEKMVWSDKNKIEPIKFPISHSRQDWADLLERLNAEFDGKWYSEDTIIIDAKSGESSRGR